MVARRCEAMGFANVGMCNQHARRGLFCVLVQQLQDLVAGLASQYSILVDSQHGAGRGRGGGQWPPAAGPIMCLCAWRQSRCCRTWHIYTCKGPNLPKALSIRTRAGAWCVRPPARTRACLSACLLDSTAFVGRGVGCCKAAIVMDCPMARVVAPPPGIRPRQGCQPCLGDEGFLAPSAVALRYPGPGHAAVCRGSAALPLALVHREDRQECYVAVCGPQTAVKRWWRCDTLCDTSAMKKMVMEMVMVSRGHSGHSGRHLQGANARRAASRASSGSRACALSPRDPVRPVPRTLLPLALLGAATADMVPTADPHGPFCVRPMTHLGR